MKQNLIVLALIFLLVGDVVCQHLEAYVLGKTLKTAAYLKNKKKSKDKKAVKYGIEAAVKGVKGKVQGKIGKPMKLAGVALGPVGIPLAVGGTLLKAKSVKNLGISGTKTVFKLSRDSVRNG